jgi:hypothetical protein
MQEPMVITHGAERQGTYYDETIDFASLSIGQQRDLAQEQWAIRNEMRVSNGRFPLPEEEFNADTVIDELRQGVFAD